MSDHRLPTHRHTAELEEDQQKSYRTILEQEIDQGRHELERETSGLLMSGLSAGLDIGFSVLAASVIITLTAGQFAEASTHLLAAAAYSIGFVLVIFGRSELYTEHTTLAFLPVLSGDASVPSLLRLWGLVYAANVVGTWAFAALLAAIGPALGVIEPAALGSEARDSVSHMWWVILTSAILAGWLMGLVSWLVTAARTTGAEIFFVVLVTSLIGLAELHHCIVGSVKLAAAIFADGGVGMVDYLRFMALATLGNTLGGVVFVAVIKYGHASRSHARR